MVKPVELLGCYLPEGPVHGDTRIVHKHVQPAQKRHGGVGHALQRRRLREIRWEGCRLAATRNDRLDHRLSACGTVRIMHRHRRTLAGERERDPPPDAGPRAGHQYPFAIHVHRPPDCSIVGRFGSSLVVNSAPPAAPAWLRLRTIIRCAHSPTAGDQTAETLTRRRRRSGRDRHKTFRSLFVECSDVPYEAALRQENVS